jgi:hypothetical protein
MEYVRKFKGFCQKVQFTNQWPGYGVILPLEIWVSNDGMTTICFFFFLPQIQKSSFISIVGES